MKLNVFFICVIIFAAFAKDQKFISVLQNSLRTEIQDNTLHVIQQYHLLQQYKMCTRLIIQSFSIS